MTEPRWGLGDAALAFVVGLVCAAAAVAIYAAATGTTEEGVGTTIAGLVGLWIGMAGVPIIACVKKGSGSLARDYGLRLEGWGDVGVGVLVGAASQFVLVNAVVLLFELLGPNVDVSDQAQEITNDSTGWRLAVLAPFVVIGAPVVEELFFRGLLLRALDRRGGSLLAVLGSAVAFGIVHAQPLPAWSLYALMTALAAFGAVLALLTVRTGRLGPGIVAHATFNAITLISLA